jgi:hypothetical protein
VHHYQKPPLRDHARRWPHQRRQRFTHNIETEPGIAAQVDVLAEHWNVTKKEALTRLVQAYVRERPTYRALLATELPQVEVPYVA